MNSWVGLICTAHPVEGMTFLLRNGLIIWENLGSCLFAAKMIGPAFLS